MVLLSTNSLVSMVVSSPLFWAFCVLINLFPCKTAVVSTVLPSAVVSCAQPNCHKSTSKSYVYLEWSVKLKCNTGRSECWGGVNCNLTIGVLFVCGCWGQGAGNLRITWSKWLNDDKGYVLSYKNKFMRYHFEFHYLPFLLKSQLLKHSCRHQTHLNFWAQKFPPCSWGEGWHWGCIPPSRSPAIQFWWPCLTRVGTLR